MSRSRALRKIRRISDIRYTLEEAARLRAPCELQMEKGGARVFLRGRLVRARYSRGESYLEVNELDAAPSARVFPGEAGITLCLSTPRGFYRLLTTCLELKSDSLRLSYPTEVEVTQRRETPRVHFHPEEAFEVFVGGEEVIEAGSAPRALVVSLSAGGFGCVHWTAGREPGLGDRLPRLTLFLPGGGEVVASGVVREVVDAAQSTLPAGEGQLRMIVFDVISPENQLRLIRFISGMETARGGRRG